jgi:hypothetical protein
MDTPQDVHRRRFAGAVLSDEAENVTRLQRETDILEDGNAEEGLVDSRKLQRGHVLSPC